MQFDLAGYGSDKSSAASVWETLSEELQYYLTCKRSPSTQVLVYLLVLVSFVLAITCFCCAVSVTVNVAFVTRIYVAPLFILVEAGENSAALERRR